MKDTSKRTVQNLFVGQFSNARAIEGAKTAPWYIAIILFLLGTFLPVVPIMVSQGNAYGSQFISGTLYGYDQYIAQTTFDLSQGGDTYKIENHHLLRYDSNGNKVENTWLPNEGQEEPADMTPIAVYNKQVDRTIEGNVTTVTARRFNVYYTDRPYSQKGSDNTVYAMLKTLTSRHYVKDAVEPTIYNGEVESKNEDLYYNASFLLLAIDGVYSYIYKSDTTTLATYTGVGFDWSYQEDSENFFKELATVNNITSDPKDTNYVKGVLENWKTVYNKAYNKLKSRNFWMLTGIFYAIFVILNAFMGLMIWLLTRGKRNPNRGLKLRTCLSISGWICFMPGLLALIFGFLIPSAQQILFIMLIGLRTMWLAMKQLNPKY